MALVDPHTVAPLGAISKSQSAVSHSSTEAEVIALDHGIRVEGLPAQQFWDTVMPIFDDFDSSVPSRGDARPERMGGPISCKKSCRNSRRKKGKEGKEKDEKGANMNAEGSHDPKEGPERRLEKE